LNRSVVSHVRTGWVAFANGIQVLDEEAKSLVKKLWRMVIFYSETEKRGIK
jgi:hypothetical protein